MSAHSALICMEHVEVVDGSIRVSARTRDGAWLPCPSCGVPCGRVHSRNVRHIADAAVGGRPVVIDLSVRRLFFTAASFLSYREAVDAAPKAQNRSHRRVFVFQPRRIDWWATAVQLAWTLYFTVSTGVAMADNLSATAAHRHVWRPDAIGSACFLVASFLCWYEVCHGWTVWRSRSRSWSWWITLVNLVGSVAFGISAVAGYTNPVTGQVRNSSGADTTTLIGAICFLVGAVLLLPERTEETR